MAHLQSGRRIIQAQQLLGRRPTLDLSHPLASGLVGFYAPGAGQGWDDFSPFRNNGIVVGAVSLVQTPHGMAGYWSGTSKLDYVAIPLTASNNLQTQTIIAWVVNGAGGAGNLFGASNHPLSYSAPGLDSAGANFRLDSGNSVQFLKQGQVLIGSTPTNSALGFGKHQFAVSYNTVGSVWKIYVDGVLSASGSSGLSFINNQYLMIGHGDSGDVASVVMIDNVKLFNRALSDAEVALEFREPFSMLQPARRRAVNPAIATVAPSRRPFLIYG